MITDWNAIAVRTIVTEAATPPPVSQLYFGFVSAAVYDAVVSVEGRYQPYAPWVPELTGDTSAEAAAATAAHQVLRAFFPASADRLAADHAASLAGIDADQESKARGVEVGDLVGSALVASRQDDGRNADIRLEPAPGPGVWEPTPPARAPMLAPWLGFVRPLLLESPDQSPLPGPDALTSPEYTADFEEVKALGSVDSTVRTAEQTETARFWSDNPIRQYQDGLRRLVSGRGLDLVDGARTFALLNTTAADALVACWRSKVDHAFWRPITAIHRADEDGNPDTVADPNWMPLIANPAYPDYPSGHACLTGAFTNGLARLFGSDIDFEVASTVTGTTRVFALADQLDEDAFNGRMWLGIHFRKPMTDGNLLGHEVSNWALDRYLQPVHQGCGWTS